jgi:DNA invertase Pin-like site-specific DNA recombinase
MGKIIAVVRKNTNFPEVKQRQTESIKEYVKTNNIKLSGAIELEISTPNEENKMEKLITSCTEGDTVIFENLSCVSRTVDETTKIIQRFSNSGVTLIIIAQNLTIKPNDRLSQVIISIFKLAVKLEKDLMSIRTKEALANKKLQGQVLGKPKGTIQSSKFDAQRDKIEELLELGLSVRKISKILGYNNHIGLNNYVKKRKIREEVMQRVLEKEKEKNSEINQTIEL